MNAALRTMANASRLFQNNPELLQLKYLQTLGEAGQGMIDAELFNMHSAQFISEHDAFLASRIAYVISGGQVRSNAKVDEQVLLTLERKAFIDFLKQDKTVARIDHMLKTGKPLRN